ncbi:hypothetical protein JX265_005721 [Neoarthrinium moseri]|uniref:N-acetyltransferase domain-containing protein n=1 Tax=Neoarthrinium moseri TaxID=1658444 RepID=A0A9P9WN20_9PEZI|nr:hypothetical protein JX266_011677 [Neoarthrinium moseri]KAI1871735.1 hypothetical protein JX265_005721 [Neoarthrinium moseri]
MIKPVDPFHSKRLLYRAIEDNADDENFIYEVQRDAEAQSGSQFSILTPESKKTSNRFKQYLLEQPLLAVIFCLPSDVSRPDGQAPTPVGIISLRGLTPTSAQHRYSYISIDVLRPYRGQGYGSEAIEWILGYGFQMANLHRIGIETFSYNTGAMKLYEKLGFRPEGCRREEVWFDGGWHDHITFGMLENEWREKMQKEQKGWRV